MERENSGPSRLSLRNACTRFSETNIPVDRGRRSSTKVSMGYLSLIS
jgi:hypothetical protein